MKKYLIIMAVACATAAHLSAGTIISQWNFESLTLSGTAATTPTPTAGSLSADVGTGTLTASHASASTVWSTPAGNDTTKSFSSNNWGVGDYYQFQVSTTGFTGINLAFFQTGSNTGPLNFTLQYSTNGTTFANFTNYTVPANGTVSIGWSPTAYAPASLVTFDLSSVTALNNAATVYFRLTDAGTGSINGTTVAAAGTGRVDSFTVSQGVVDITPVPESSTVTLIGVGLGLILFSARRRRA